MDLTHLVLCAIEHIADDEMALGLQEDNADQMFGGATVSSVHAGSETDPTIPPSSTMNIPEIVESNELLKAQIEAAAAHNQELESALAELRRKMKAIHVSSDRCKTYAKNRGFRSFWPLPVQYA